MLASSLLVAARAAVAPPGARRADLGELFAPAHDAVRATLRRIGRGRGRAGLFEITIDNRSVGPVEAVVFARRRGEPIPMSGASRIGVPGGTFASTIVEVARARGASEVVAEVSSRGSTFVIAALRLGTRRRAVAVVAAAALGAGVAAMAALHAASPGVSAVSVPGDARTGTTIEVAYALARATDASYRLVDSAGLAVAGGALAGAAGAFALPLPAGASARLYTLDLTARNRFGSAERDVALLAAPPAPIARPAPVVVRRPPPEPFSLGRADVAKPAVAAGKAIVVTYEPPKGASGSVRLIDEQGTVRAQALLSASGTSMLLAPLVAADQDFTVAIDAARGDRRTQTAVPVRILKAHDMDDAIAEARRTHAGPLVLGATTVASGDSIDVGVVEHEPQLRVALQDPLGTEIGSVPVSVDRNVVSIVAPTVAAPVQYLVVGTYDDGSGEQTILRPVTIVPAPKTP